MGVALCHRHAVVTQKVFDGNQINTILQTVLFNQWQQVAGSLIWSNYSPTVTWANAENNGLGEIDMPGDYELTARSSSTIDVYSLVASLASSGLGYIYEDSQGRIGYADSTHRATYLATYGYVDLDAAQAISSSMSLSTRGGDVRNYVTITYKNSAEASASDSTSINTYGLLAENISTSLENTADAASQANFYLTLRAYPQAIFSEVSFNLGNDQIDNADRDSLINMAMGIPINLTGLPTNMGSNFQGFVEGWRWQATYNSLLITLSLTPVAYSLQAFRWTSVPVAETWNTISPTLEWLNATVVA